MITKQNVKDIHEGILSSIVFTDGSVGYGQATELGCKINQMQDNGWYLVTEYDFDGFMLSQGYEKV